ncbi:MAG: hypothetical protein ACLF0G_18000 [Candidatus Brocadiia bacterium]
MRAAPLAACAAAMALAAAAVAAPALPQQAKGDHVVSIAYIEVPEVDFGAFRQTVHTLLGEHAAFAAEGLRKLEDTRGKFLDAGGTTLAMVLPFPPPEPGVDPRLADPEPFVLIRLRKDEDEPAMRQMLADLAGGGKQIVTLFAPGWLSYSQEETPQPGDPGEHRKRLDAALAAAGKSPAGLVFAPNPPFRTMQRTVVKQEADEVDLPIVVKKFMDFWLELVEAQWLAFSVTLGEEPRATGVCLMPTEDAAARLGQRLKAIGETARKIDQGTLEDPRMPLDEPHVAQLLKSLVPFENIKLTQDGPKLTFELTTAQLRAFTLPWVFMARHARPAPPPPPNP